MKVKASEMERLFGLSPNGIKLYEKQGIISPERLRNEYRMYGEKELMSMGYALQLRRFGFSLQDTLGLMTEAGFEGQEEAFLARTQKIEEEMDALLRIRKTLRFNISQGQLSKRLLGKCEVLPSSAAYFLVLRRGEEWLSQEAISLSRQWIDTYSPHTYSAILFDGPYFSQETYSTPPQYGLYVPGDIALEIGFLPSKLVTYLVPKPCIHTAFLLYYESPDYQEPMDLVRRYAKEKGLSLQGGGCTTVMGCLRKEEGLLCLCLLRVPLLAEDGAYGQIR